MIDFNLKFINIVHHFSAVAGIYSSKCCFWRW